MFFLINDYLLKYDTNFEHYNHSAGGKHFNENNISYGGRRSKSYWRGDREREEAKTGREGIAH